MRRDSNSREPCDPTRFPGVRLKPLGHPSKTRVRRVNPADSAIPLPEAQETEAVRRVRRSPTITTLQSNRNPKGLAHTKKPHPIGDRMGLRLYGQGEIRTHDTLAGTPVFETGAFNHSATYPERANRRTHEFRRPGGTFCAVWRSAARK